MTVLSSLMSGVWLWMIFVLSTWIVTSNAGLNIALHAQVAPDQGKIVGSVITTNGLKAALEKRYDVDKVEIFYPTQHKGFFETQWDVLIIEGWFLPIAEFIQITRHQLPNIVVIFYCLDPAYPSLPEIMQFDVDGIMTNSRHVQAFCERVGIPNVFVMLAADPDAMQANFSSHKLWDAVYVGAGGLMLTQKPRLRQMLLDVHPFRLRLHGTGWEGVPNLGDLSQGPLPQNDLDDAYNSAEVVLAYTIESQDKFGMINNRMFEALATGSIVLCEESNTLRETFGDLLYYYHNQSSIHSLIDRLQRDQDYAMQRRQQARDFVLKGHTWSHRAVQVMAFVTHLISKRIFLLETGTPSLRKNRPKMLWVVSRHLRSHLDYTLVVHRHVQASIRRHFDVEEIDEEQLEHCFSSTTMDKSCKSTLQGFESIFAVITPYDPLDLFLRQLAGLEIVVRGKVQRRLAYVLGVDDRLVSEYCEGKEESTIRCRSYEHYDVILYRSEFEINYLTSELGIQLPPKRLRHCYGFGEYPEHLENIMKDSKYHQMSNVVQTYSELPVSICIYHHWHQCRSDARLRALQTSGFYSSDHIVVMLGGKWEEWLQMPDVVNIAQLHLVVHVGNEMYHDGLLRILSGKNVSMVFSGGSQSDPSSLDPWTTLPDVLYPLIGSIVYNGKLYLSAVNSHFMYLADGKWGMDLQYLDSSVKVALDQAFGMPPIHSKIKFELLRFRVNATEVICWNCNEFDHELLNSGYVTHLFTTKRNPFLILRLQNEHFMAGRDGQFCVGHIRGTLDSTTCMIRSMNHLVIQQDDVDFDGRNIRDFELSFSLRGNFYANHAYTTNHTITYPLEHPMRISPPASFNQAVLNYLYEYSYPYIV